MASKGTINSIIDQQAVNRQIKDLTAQIDALITKIESVPSVALKIAGDMKGAKSITDVNDATKKLTDVNVELQKVLADTAKKQAQIDSLRNGEAKANAQVAESLKALKAEKALQAKIDAAAEGSIKRMQLELQKLKAEYYATGDALKRSELLQKTAELNQKVLDAEKAIGVFGRQVGNYELVVKGLREELVKVTTRMDDLKKAGKTNTDEFKLLSAQAGILEGKIKDVGEESDKTGGDKGIMTKFGMNLLSFGKYLLGVGAGLGLVTGLTGAWKTVIFSTQATADAFEATMGGLKEATNFFARAIVNLDFTNLVSGFKDAFAEGKRYAGVLDELGDKQLALGLQQKNIDLEIARLKVVGRDRLRDVSERQAAVDQIIKLEEEKLTITQKYNKEGLENELTHASKITGLDRRSLVDLLTNYEKYTEKLSQAAEKEAEIRKKSTKEYASRTGVTEQIFDPEAYRKNIAELDQGMQTWIRLSQGFNNLKDDERKKLAESLGNMLDSEKAYNEGMTSIVKLRSTLVNEFDLVNERRIKSDEKAAKAAEDNIKKEIEALNKLKQSIEDFFGKKAASEGFGIARQMQEELTILGDSLKNGEITVEDFEANKLEIQSRYARLSLEAEIKNLEAKIVAARFSGIETTEEERKLFDMKNQLYDLDLQRYKDHQDSMTETAEKADKEKKEIEEKAKKRELDLLALKRDLYKQAAESLISISNSIFEKQITNIEEASEKDREAKEKELELAGDNKQKQDEINAKYAEREKVRERQRKKIEHDKAIFNKMASVFNIGLYTAEGIMKAIAEYSMPAATPFIAIIAALGALQTAAVLAQPIPKYFKGRQGGPAELAWVGERGQEAIRLDDGSMFFTPAKPTLTFLPEGSDVIPNHDLARIVRNTSFSGSPVMSIKSNDYKDLQGEIRELKGQFDRVVSAIKTKREYHFNFDENGFSTAVRDGQNFTRYINRNVKL